MVIFWTKDRLVLCSGNNNIICSSYIALFLVKASSKWFTISLADLLHPSPPQLPGKYTPTYTLQGATGNLSTIAISIARYSFTGEWTRAPLSSPIAHARCLGFFWANWFFFEPTGFWRDSNPRSCGWESDSLTIRPSQPDKSLVIYWW